MKSLISHTTQVWILLTAALVVFPVHAGGARSTAAIHKGHSISHRGVASFYHNSRNLPNGVSIFHRPSHASRAPVNKGNKRKHTRNSHGNVKNKANFRHKIKKQKHARNDGGRLGSKKRSKRKHKQHKKRRLVYGTTVYVAPAPDEYIYPEYADEENCRHLTERGYDRTGRRVLVEWTLCFDEQGTAYVPAEGRRILARY